MKAAQSTMEIPDLDVEEQPPDETKEWITQISMQERHRAGQDAAAKPVTHDEIVSLAQLDNEVVEMGEVVAVVCVTHHNVAPERGRDTCAKRGAVAALFDQHDPNIFFARYCARIIGRTVVRDEHFAS